MAVAGFPKPVIPGNLPTDIRYRVRNPDGSISTVRTISVGTERGEVLIPTVINGKVVSNDEAIAHFERTGENFGTFRTPDEATAFAQQLHRQHERKMRPQGGSGFRPVNNGAEAIKQIFPDAYITDTRRNPNSSLGKKNPRSYHVQTGAAVDMGAIPGMSFDQARKAIEGAGYQLIEAIDEYSNPSPYATGGHWHFVLGSR